MAVGSGDPISSHIGNGVTRSFGYGFTLLNAADLRVTIDGEVTSAYTVFGIGAAEGGTIEFTTAPANGARVLLELDIDLERKTQYQTNGDLLSRTVNDDFDRLWQALNVASYPGRARALRVPVGETVNDLPTATERANTILGFSGTGQPIVLDLPEDLPETSINRPPDVVATQGQTDVTVPFTYTRGNNSLRVFLNGGLQEPGDDYIELTTTSIRFTAPLDVGDEVTFEGGARLNPSSAIDGLSAEAAAAPGGLSLIGYSASLTPTPGSAAERLMRTPITVDAITAVNATALGLVDGDVLVARGRTTAGDGGGGTFRYVATSPQTVDGGLVFQPTAGGGRLFRDGWTAAGFNGPVNAQWFGAVSGQPSAAAINAALTAALVVFVPVGSYLAEAVITLPYFGSELQCAGGVGGVTLTATHTLGPVIQLTRAQQKVTGGPILDSNSTRYAAAVTTFNVGVAIGGAAAGTNRLTLCVLEDVIAQNQPSHGFYLGGEGAGTMLARCNAQYNLGHGFIFDDGTIGSRPSTSRLGIVTLTNCRAAENGGNATNIAASGLTAYRVLLDNFEALDNAWNTAISGLLNQQYVVRCQNFISRLCAADDQRFADTVMANGRPRLAKASKSSGWDIRNGSTDVLIERNRYLVLTWDITVRTGVNGVRVAGAYSEPTKGRGVNIESGALNVRAEFDDLTPYTIPVYSVTGGEICRLNGAERVVGITTASTFALNRAGLATIATNSLNAQTEIVYVSGEGGLADDLQTVVMAGGANPIPAGQTVKIINRNAYTITVKNGAGIKTRTGADVLLTTNLGISLASDGSGVVYEV